MNEVIENEDTITVKIDASTYDICNAYATEISEKKDDYYASINQTDPAKLKYNYLVGTMGEFAVYEYLKLRGLNPTEPRTVVEAKASWAPDLMVDDIAIHVKTQSHSQAIRYGLSWSFQRADEEIFIHKSGTATFCEYFDDSREVIIHHLIDVVKLHTGDLFNYPQLPRYRKYKRVVYHTDLMKYYDTH